MPDDTTVTYVSKRAPGFGFTVDIDGKTHRVKCVNRMFTVEAGNTKLIEAIDAAIAENPNVAREFTKVDREAAERTAREFVSRQKAIKGGFSSAGLNAMQQQTIDASTKALNEAAPNNPDALREFKEELAGGDREITEPAAPPAPPTPNAAATLLGKAKK